MSKSTYYQLKSSSDKEAAVLAEASNAEDVNTSITGQTGRQTTGNIKTAIVCLKCKSTLTQGEERLKKKKELGKIELKIEVNY